MSDTGRVNKGHRRHPMFVHKKYLSDAERQRQIQIIRERIITNKNKSK